MDAVWLRKIAERQMIRASFVPLSPIRRFQDLTRYRAALVSDRTGEKSRVEKLLEDARIKLSVVASDIFGVSGPAMLDQLIGGQRNPKVLAQLPGPGRGPNPPVGRSVRGLLHPTITRSC